MWLLLPAELNIRNPTFPDDRQLPHHFPDKILKEKTQKGRVPIEYNF